MVELYRDASIVLVDKPHGVSTEEVFEAYRVTEPYVGLHHRLDRPASGILLLAVDRRANTALASMFREHRIERTYLVRLWGLLAGEATWEWPLDGKDARTVATPLSSAEGTTLVEVRLHTGRMHQIRRHAAMAGLPVLGDRRYGGDAGRASGRLALHAWKLGFDHPVTGQRVLCVAPVPAGL